MVREKTILAFDLYGTLIDTSSVSDALRKLGLFETEEEIAEFTRRWREKQLSYAYRRGLMKNYVDFDVCTNQALECVGLEMDITINDYIRTKLARAYNELSLHHDVQSALTKFNLPNFGLYVFTNGKRSKAEYILKYNKIQHVFHGIVSCEDIKTYKPSPDAYEYLCEQTKAKPNNVWLISSNSFDVIGAINYGLKAAFIQRSTKSILDPWKIHPTTTVNDISQLADALI
ncbi:haloacid dehalogenase type II [Planctomycetota bacterium]|nr:haloacid dehalogenase type II [Planctomycetota bacterium]